MKIVKKYHLDFFIPLLIIMFISFFNMYNARLINDSYTHHLIKQIFWYVLGFISLFIISKINISQIMKHSFFIYLINVLLLILVLLFGHEVNNARAWFKIGPIAFQPSELMKLSLALFLVNMLGNANIKSKKDELKLILKVSLFTLIPAILVFLEPDTGAIIFFMLIAGALLLALPISKWWFLPILLILTIGIGTFTFLYLNNQDLLIHLIGTSFFYRVERILTFTNQNSYQLENALIVMGSSHLLGTGFNKTSLYIPEAPTDFIFAYNIGNFGLLSGFVVLLCYYFMDLALIKWLLKTRGKKIKLFLISFISIFFFQQLINIGMNLGLLPIIGIPLPFLSYGGSTIICYFLFLGLILKLERYGSFT